MKKESKYDPAIDILRIISILAVVMIHTTTRTLEVTKYDLLKVPWTLILNQIFRFAVPVFFMLSGFVLELNFSNHSSYLTYIKKRISRIFVPYVFWSTIYYFFIYKKHTEGFITSVIKGDSSYQLYFIPALLILYIIFPLVHRFYSIISHRFILVAFGIIQLVILYMDYTNPSDIFFPIRIAILNYFIFLLGVVSARHKNELVLLIKKWYVVLAFVSAGLAGYIYYEGLNGYINTHNYLSFYSQWRISVLFYSVLISGLLYSFFQNRVFNFSFIKRLSSLTFFIFFIHVIVLEVIWRVVISSLFKLTQNRVVEQVWYDPLFFFVVVIISYLIAYTAHKIPKLSKLTG